jgi:hypothetical protein
MSEQDPTLPEAETGLEALRKEVSELRQRVVVLEEGRHPGIEGYSIDTINLSLTGMTIPFYMEIGTDGDYEGKIIHCPHLGRLTHSHDAGIGGAQCWKTMDGKYVVMVGGYDGRIMDVTLGKTE